MNAVIICDNHSGHPKKIYDLCDLDEKGRVSKLSFNMVLSLRSNPRQTALQVFTETYKQAHNSEKTYGLLRKARRLDQVIAAPRFDAVPVLEPALVLSLYNKCIFCSTEFSPYWWEAPHHLVTNGMSSTMDMDVKTANGDAESSSPGSDIMPIDNVHAMETEVDGPPPKRGICHTCYVQRMKEKDLPVVLDLTSPILVT